MSRNRIQMDGRTQLNSKHALLAPLHPKLFSNTEREKHQGWIHLKNIQKLSLNRFALPTWISHEGHQGSLHQQLKGFLSQHELQRLCRALQEHRHTGGCSSDTEAAAALEKTGVVMCWTLLNYWMVLDSQKRRSKTNTRRSPNFIKF